MQACLDTSTLPWHPLAVMPETPRIPPTSLTQPVARAIEMVALQEVQLLDVTGPLQVFATTNETIAKGGGVPAYTVRVVARQTRSVTTSAGIMFAVDDLPAPDTPIDTLIVAGGPGVQRAATDAELVSWVKARAETARRTASVCTGAYLLAATGHLDGRRTATHWSFCDDLARSFPALHVEGDPILVRDGAVWTSAGVTAGIDLALALVEEDLGRAWRWPWRDIWWCSSRGRGAKRSSARRCRCSPERNRSASCTPGSTQISAAICRFRSSPPRPP